MGTKFGLTLSEADERDLARLWKRVSAERCTFCGKTRREVKALIANACPPGIHPAFICNECVGQCVDILEGK